VREAWEVMGRPVRLDTSEKQRNQKLQALGMSEDGYIIRAWAAKIRKYHSNQPTPTKYFAEKSLNWTGAQAHARCLHYGGWCMDLLGLPKLQHPCEECALSGSNTPRSPRSGQCQYLPETTVGDATSWVNFTHIPRILKQNNTH